MFEGWDNFFLLVGGAGGGLIGLLFVVVTLGGRPRDRDAKLRGIGIYMGPIVFHMAAVLVLSAFADAPLPRSVQGVAFGAAALVGLAYCGRVVMALGVRRTLTPAHWTDVWCYGLLPMAAYVPLGAAAAATWRAPQWAAASLALALVSLLLLGIRNAWDLVTWISAQPNPPETTS
jgi:hypothetical protein